MHELEMIENLYIHSLPNAYEIPSRGVIEFIRHKPGLWERLNRKTDSPNGLILLDKKELDFRESPDIKLSSRE